MRARQVADAMLQRFAQPDGALSGSWDTTDLLVAPPPEGDSVKPSGQSAAIALLLELAESTHEVRYATAARRALTHISSLVGGHPAGWGTLMVALSNPGLRAALDGGTDDNALASAGTLPDSADHVSAEGHWAPSKQGVDIVLKISIDDGYHINANPASDSYLIATQLLIDGQASVKVNYPASQTFKAPFAPRGIAVYQGSITLQAHLPQALAAHPPVVGLRVQACNDKVCLAPATITVPISNVKVHQE